MSHRPWRLTVQAENSLTDIALWTIETFGPRQAQAYERDLSAECERIAAGSVPSRSCRSAIDPGLPEELRFTRFGQHLIVFIEAPEQVVIVDFVHARRDLPGRLTDLARGKEGGEP